ncbi:MAG: MTH1187 family thiamine-binding protein [Thermoplasmata archaeon]
MLAEFSIVPIGKDVSLSKYVAKSLDLIDKSGLGYRINPMGTVVEGNWDEVMGLIKKSHDVILKESERVVTTIKIDDRKGVTNALNRKIKSVEEKLGRELKK